eukprot:364425-Chlamydomonas_euryale.AAC.12
MFSCSAQQPYRRAITAGVNARPSGKPTTPPRRKHALCSAVATPLCRGLVTRPHLHARAGAQAPAALVDPLQHTFLLLATGLRIPFHARPRVGLKQLEGGWELPP